MDANKHEWQPGEREAFEANPPPAWHLAVLREREAEYRANPGSAIPLELVKIQLRALRAKERNRRKG